MKRFIYIIGIALLTLSQSAFAQNIGDLSGIYYQAVAIDENGKEIVGMDVEGKPLYNKAIGVRFTITQGLDGGIQWQETHTTTTDKYGLFSLVIGKGAATSSSNYNRLLDMPWIDADQFLKVEIATKNDGNYKLVSNQQFMAVPYAFYTDDIADNAITTAKILDYTILNEDVATGSIDSRTILDGTILNEDIATGAIDSRTILDGTILNEDVATGSVDSRTILNGTILNEDVATGSIDSRTILDGTILNEDIADGTIDLAGKATGILPVQNGGTGLSGGTVTDGQLLIGNGTNGAYNMANLTPGTGIVITNTPGGIVISSSVVGGGGVNTEETGVENIGDIDATKSFVTQIPLPGVEPGDFVVASYSLPLNGCLISGYVRNVDEIEVVIYNANDTTVNLGVGTFKVLVIK